MTVQNCAVGHAGPGTRTPTRLDPSLADEAPWLLGLSQTLWEITRGDGQEFTFRARSIDVVPPVAPELESQTHAKGKDV